MHIGPHASNVRVQCVDSTQVTFFGVRQNLSGILIYLKNLEIVIMAYNLLPECCRPLRHSFPPSLRWTTQPQRCGWCFQVKRITYLADSAVGM